MNEIALDGIRVLDFANHHAELAGRVLADLGAEVICVEPTGGSPSRQRAPLHPGDHSRSLWWETVAVGKRSVTLDLFDDGARAQLRQLIASADVLIESFDPGFMASIGLDYESVRSINPELIYTSVSPFGQSGPKAHLPATDLTIEAAGGLIGLQGDQDRPPVPLGLPQASLHAGVQAAADTLIALNARAAGAGGQHLDVSMQAAVVWTLMNATGFPTAVGRNPAGLCEERGHGRPAAIAGMRPMGVLECADGHFVLGLMMRGVGERTLAQLVDWLKVVVPDRVDADIAATNWSDWISAAREGRLDIDVYNRAFDLIVGECRTRTKRFLLDLAIQRKLLLAPIASTEDLLADPHLETREFWQDVGGVSVAGPFARLSRTPICYRSSAPSAGADNALLEEIAAEAAHKRSGEHKSSGPSRALEGVKVADFAWVGVGPIISKALADHGATVVHVESSKRLDVLRMLPPFKDGQPGTNRSQFFANFNSGKLSVDLDFKNPDDLSMAHQIAGWADVVVESFTPGNMAKYGLDYGQLSANRDDLIMLSTCMRGQTGPQRAYTGFGNQGAALAGLFSITGWPDRPPCGPWGAYTDFIAPRFGVCALAAALHHRQRTGLGQYIDLSQIETGVHFMGPLVAETALTGNPALRAGQGSRYASPNGVFADATGTRYVAVAVEDDQQWRGLCSLLELDAMWDVSKRMAHAELIQRALTDWLGCRTAEEGVQTLLAAYVPAQMVAWPSDLHEDPQLAERGFFVPLDHPEMGVTSYDGHVTRFSETPPKLGRAPCIGEHTESVRAWFDKALDAAS